jgi:hypothetical protein
VEQWKKLSRPPMRQMPHLREGMAAATAGLLSYHNNAQSGQRSGLRRTCEWCEAHGSMQCGNLLTHRRGMAALFNSCNRRLPCSTEASTAVMVTRPQLRHKQGSLVAVVWQWYVAVVWQWYVAVVGAAFPSRRQKANKTHHIKNAMQQGLLTRRSGTAASPGRRRRSGRQGTSRRL